MIPFSLCGAENPLGVNMQLARLDEKRPDKVDLWDQSIDEAFRYTFAPAPSPSMEDALPWLSRMCVSLAIKGRVFVGWRFHDTGTFRIRSRVMEVALQREGWNIAVVDGIALASRDLDLCAEQPGVPEVCVKHLQGFFVLFGGTLSLTELCAPPFEASVRHFSIMQRLQPSTEFVRAICSRGVSVAYTSTAYDVRYGIVLVGPSFDAPDVAELQRAGLIQQTFWNEQAIRVWYPV